MILKPTFIVVVLFSKGQLIWSGPYTLLWCEQKQKKVRHWQSQWCSDLSVSSVMLVLLAAVSFDSVELLQSTVHLALSWSAHKKCVHNLKKCLQENLKKPQEFQTLPRVIQYWWVSIFQIWKWKSTCDLAYSFENLTCLWW